MIADLHLHMGSLTASWSGVGRRGIGGSRKGTRIGVLLLTCRLCGRCERWHSRKAAPANPGEQLNVHSYRREQILGLVLLGAGDPIPERIRQERAESITAGGGESLGLFYLGFL